jgi:hypothetical protein
MAKRGSGMNPMDIPAGFQPKAAYLIETGTEYVQRR